jgi:hypothetical protein
LLPLYSGRNAPCNDAGWKFKTTNKLFRLASGWLSSRRAVWTLKLMTEDIKFIQAEILRKVHGTASIESLPVILMLLISQYNAKI